jgi:hypothetical protein
VIAPSDTLLTALQRALLALVLPSTVRRPAASKAEVRS